MHGCESAFLQFTSFNQVSENELSIFIYGSVPKNMRPGLAIDGRFLLFLGVLLAATLLATGILSEVTLTI